MIKRIFSILFLSSISCFSQQNPNRITKKIVAFKKDTIQIDSVSIRKLNFKIFANNKEIDSSKYTINFEKAQVIFKSNYKIETDSIKILYTKYPSFLTKTYFAFSKKLIVKNNRSNPNLYSLQTNNTKKTIKPFDGLKASGSITRGLTVGNNQNGVVNSSMDLQLEGNLSNTVKLKGSIIDTNIPIQENGNTYKLNEFDRVFIQLTGKNWGIDAGDIYLNNNEGKFLNFNKKVSGLRVYTSIKNKKSELKIKTSGAIVRGKYQKVQFTGIEGNQGPYQLNTFSNAYVLILQGTEKIYINGHLLKRGEQNDYVIDYNNAEITFNSTFPITANMRISAEFQYNDQVYTRFITYNQLTYKTKKLNVTTHFYNENDLKNQSLSGDLTNEQKQILADAGNNENLMNAPSAYVDTFSETKILYRKINSGNNEYFEYSTDSTQTLYHVSFSFVGENNGNYALKEALAVGKVYEFVGTNLGDYNPIIKLSAPNKLQIGQFKTLYQPSNNTIVNSEFAISNYDANLFSKKDDNNNVGYASKLGWNQTWLNRKLNVSTNFQFENINQHFKSIERIQNIEFNRDWNVSEIIGNQQLLTTELQLAKKEKSEFLYRFENLMLGNHYRGNRHTFMGKINSKKLFSQFKVTDLTNSGNFKTGHFLRFNFSAGYHKKRFWLGSEIHGETNTQKETITANWLTTNHKFKEINSFLGIGDSTKVFAKIGAQFRVTDSVQNNRFIKVNQSKTYYINSKLIQSKKASLTTYINYRKVNNTQYNNEQSLNSKINYQQQLFNQFIQLNTTFQTISGNLPQQDYSYIETEPGQGFYTWIDYNNNGIKELNEFEIAQFQDQAKYLRIILPTITYLPTHQNKYLQTVNFNFSKWKTKTGLKKVLSHFTNFTNLLFDNKLKKKPNSFNLNPFSKSNPNSLALNYQFSNSLNFNRGIKKFSTTYTVQESKNKTLNTIDLLSYYKHLQALSFEHKLGKFWVIYFKLSQEKNSTFSLNFNNRNYTLKIKSINPKLSYYFNDTFYFSLIFDYKNKRNIIGNLEQLNFQKLGITFNKTIKNKNFIKFSVDYLNNNFTGNAFSPVGYQMLEGFQTGKNYTWQFNFRQNINSYLNLSLNYFGRKSENSKTIHTGTIQLKAFF
ncbi:MAG: hypothetical protein ACWA42_00475 [Lutibacter sp.]